MTELLLVGVAVVAFALASDRLAGSVITAPMVFTGFGLLVGSAGLGWFDPGLQDTTVTILVEATLVLVLFTDAMRIDVGSLRRHAVLPGRLLLVGLPVSFGFGVAAALLVFGALSLGEAALVAAVLCPTDAALGRSVVEDRRLPVRLRQAVNVESGLNDGLILPVVTIALALAAAEAAPGETLTWVRFAVEQIGVGFAVGAVVGVAGGSLLGRSMSAGHIDPVYRQLGTVAVAVVAYGAAELTFGNGFLAVFVAGLSLGRMAHGHRRELEHFAEEEGELLSIVTFTLFGAVFVAPALELLDLRIVVYSVLSLTVVRIVPVLLALIGSGTLLETRLFLGWFGPRGLATILFVLIVVDTYDGPGVDTVTATATWTVLLSVFVHGVTAAPWSGRLARRLGTERRELHEHGPAPEHPTRRRHRSVTGHR